MKLDRENRFTREVPLGGQSTENVEVQRLDSYQLQKMGIPESVTPGIYALERNDQGFVYALTPVELETVTEYEQFRDNKTALNNILLEKLKG